MKIGAQLYTLHRQLTTLEAFAEGLDRVADMGYTTVQVSGTCPYEADWLAEQLKRTGLTCDLTHVNFDRMTEDPAKVAADHAKFGCKYIGLGMMPNLPTVEDKQQVYNEFSERVAPVLKTFKEHGAMFMYHNHALEFNYKLGGRMMMEHMMEDFDNFGFILDTYWVKYAEQDPVEWLKKLSGRIPAIHFKDMKVMEDGSTRYAPIGEGILDFDAIAAAAEAGGTEFAFVEMDDTYGEDPFDCLKRSYDYLKAMGLN